MTRKMIRGRKTRGNWGENSGLGFMESESEARVRDNLRNVRGFI